MGEETGHQVNTFEEHGWFHHSGVPAVRVLLRSPQCSRQTGEGGPERSCITEAPRVVNPERALERKWCVGERKVQRGVVLGPILEQIAVSLGARLLL